MACAEFDGVCYGGQLGVDGKYRDEQTAGCEDHKYAHTYRRMGGTMTDVPLATCFEPLHICEKNSLPLLHVKSSATCVLGGDPPQLSRCEQNMHTTRWVANN